MLWKSLINMRAILCLVAAGLLVGCGASSDAARSPPKPSLTRAEVRRLVDLHIDLLGFCNAAQHQDEIDATDYKTSMRAIHAETAAYGKVLRSIDAYVAILRRKPDAMPPAGNVLLKVTAREDAKDLLSDELTCDASTARDGMKQWRDRIRIVLAGLPPTPTQKP